MGSNKSEVEMAHASVPQQFTWDKLINVTVLKIIDPAHYIIKEAASKEMSSIARTFVKMEEALNYHFNYFDEQPCEMAFPAKETLIVVKYPEDNRWYRAKVNCVLQTTKGPCISVNLVDYGYSILMNKEWIRHIPEPFTEVPFQAMKLTLLGLKPLSMEMDDSDLSFELKPSNSWDIAAKDHVSTLITGSAQVEIEKIGINNELFGKLYVDYQSQNVCINDTLLKENFAYVSEDEIKRVRNAQQISNQEISLSTPNGELSCHSPPNISSSIADKSYLLEKERKAKEFSRELEELAACLKTTPPHEEKRIKPSKQHKEQPSLLPPPSACLRGGMRPKSTTSFHILDESHGFAMVNSVSSHAVTEDLSPRETKSAINSYLKVLKKNSQQVSTARSSSPQTSLPTSSDKHGKCLFPKVTNVDQSTALKCQRLKEEDFWHTSSDLENTMNGSKPVSVTKFHTSLNETRQHQKEVTNLCQKENPLPLHSTHTTPSIYSKTKNMYTPQVASYTLSHHLNNESDKIDCLKQQISQQNNTLKQQTSQQNNTMKQQISQQNNTPKQQISQQNNTLIQQISQQNNTSNQQNSQQNNASLNPQNIQNFKASQQSLYNSPTTKLLTKFQHIASIHKLHRNASNTDEVKRLQCNQSEKEKMDIGLTTAAASRSGNVTPSFSPDTANNEHWTSVMDASLPFPPNSQQNSVASNEKQNIINHSTEIRRDKVKIDCLKEKEGLDSCPESVNTKLLLPSSIDAACLVSHTESQHNNKPEESLLKSCDIKILSQDVPPLDANKEIFSDIDNLSLSATFSGSDNDNSNIQDKNVTSLFKDHSIHKESRTNLIKKFQLLKKIAIDSSHNETNMALNLSPNVKKQCKDMESPIEHSTLKSPNKLVKQSTQMQNEQTVSIQLQTEQLNDDEAEVSCEEFYNDVLNRLAHTLERTQSLDTPTNSDNNNENSSNNSINSDLRNECLSHTDREGESMNNEIKVGSKEVLSINGLVQKSEMIFSPLKASASTSAEFNEYCVDVLDENNEENLVPLNSEREIDGASGNQTFPNV